MSEKKPHYIPHPLCQSDAKVDRNDLENIDVYVRDSTNPRWAASHLVRAVAKGLLSADPLVARYLSQLADRLSQNAPPTHTPEVHIEWETAEFFAAFTGQVSWGDQERRAKATADLGKAMGIQVMDKSLECFDKNIATKGS